MPTLLSGPDVEAPDKLVRLAGLLERARRALHLGEQDTATKLWRQIIAADPFNVGLLIEFATALMNAGRLKAAIFRFESALHIDPHRIDAWIRRGVALSHLGEFAEALISFQRAIYLTPEGGLAQHHAAATLSRLGRSKEAHALTTQLAQRFPNDAEIANTHAMLLKQFGRYGEALAEFDRALLLSPDLHQARFNRADLLMLLGDLPRGSRDFEARWQYCRDISARRSLEAPLWLGDSSLSGKTILFHFEQGFGDTLHFCRYAAQAADAGARVILEVQEPLADLMATVPGVAQVVTSKDVMPPHDLRCPMMSLPLAFGTTLETIPANIPYLHADSTLAMKWRGRLSSLTGLRVGLVWAAGDRMGNADLITAARGKSLSLAALAPLAAVEGCAFVSIQLGPAAAEVSSPVPDMVLHDYTSEIRDFADTAALIDALDLVISVDKSVAHLAGAMGKPVWLLNRYDTCWRWLLYRDDNPWYPSLRQFRQISSRDWTVPVNRVADALRNLVGQTGHGMN